MGISNLFDVIELQKQSVDIIVFDWRWIDLHQQTHYPQFNIVPDFHYVFR